MKSYRFLLLSLDKAADYILNFFSIYVCYYIVVLQNTPYFQLNTSDMLFTGLGISLILSFLYSYFNLYQPMRTQRMPFFLSRLFLIHLMVTGLCALTILWFLKDVYRYYTNWVLLSAVITTSTICIKKISMMVILRNLRSNQKNIKYILIVTDSQEMVDNYMEELERNPHFGYSVIGYVGNLNILGLPHLGTTADLDRVLSEYKPDEVVMAFETVRKKVVTKYISVCNDNCCKVLFIPAICGFFRAPRQVTTVGNLPLIDIRSSPLDNMANQTLKRLMDIVIAALMIIITSPLMLFTAIGVKLSSPGPILFKQVRVGRHNENFTMYKFRSMRVNDREQTGWSNENDPRKTRFGAFIRKVALDELPQLFNVLKGDMSLVGPRPEVPFYVEKFKKEIPLYMLKHTLRPGITGLAQIKGLRGDTSIADRIEEDINYIENWSFWGDIRILILTPFKMINRHEKYVAHETAHAKREEEKSQRTYVSRKTAAADTDAESAPEGVENETTADSTDNELQED